MKKWMFSNNGEITGPLDLAAANEFINEHPDVYAWHPSYSHWLPVSSVEEFELKVTPPPAPVEINDDLIENFVDKERALLKELERIARTLQTTMNSLQELNADIDSYSTVTKDLNKEVQLTVSSIEQQYEILQKNLSNMVSH